MNVWLKFISIGNNNINKTTFPVVAPKGYTEAGGWKKGGITMADKKKSNNQGKQAPSKDKSNEAKNENK